MLAGVLADNAEVYQSAWMMVNPEGSEYVLEDKLMYWIRLVMKSSSIVDSEEENVDYYRIIKEYVKEKHSLDSGNVASIEFTFGYAVDFLKWYGNYKQRTHKYHEKYEELDLNESDEEEAKQQEKYLNDGDNETEHVTKHVYLSESIVNEIQHALINSSDLAKLIIPHSESYHPQPGQLNSSESLKSKYYLNNEINISMLASKYKYYLKIIFDHYRKLSYTAGQDPTFEQIKHNATIMTINKFMMFCRDFKISKASPMFNRAFLVEMFKKNAVCYKEMDYDMFMAVIGKLAVSAFGESMAETQTYLSAEMVKWLSYLEIATQKDFRNKAEKLAINMPASKGNIEGKKVSLGYKFKLPNTNAYQSYYQPKENGPQYQRKVNRSYMKDLLKSKSKAVKSSLSLHKKPRVDNYPLKIIYARPFVPPSQTPQSIPHKRLASLVPPARRISNVEKTVGYENDSKGTIFLKYTPKYLPSSYAYMHKLRSSYSYPRKSILTKKYQGLKLNNIVSYAKMFLAGAANYPYNDPYSYYISTSGPAHSREQHRLKLYDMYRVSKNMHAISIKTKKYRYNQYQLSGLIDMEFDDEDYFLKEHLYRERKNEQMGKRLAERISYLDQ